jgi:hypothetical protein
LRFHANTTSGKFNFRNKRKIETHPESTGEESNHAAHIAWFLASWCDTFIDTFAQPNVGFHVPRVEKHLEVGCELDLEDFYVRSAIPKRLSMSTNVGESETSQDTCTLVMLVQNEMR